MKKFDDFLDFVDSDPDDNIHVKCGEVFLTEYEKNLENPDSSSQTALYSAMITSAKAYTVDMLRRYHEWQNKE